MDKNDYRNEFLKNREYALEAEKGDLIMDVTESICEILDKKNMDRKDLANNMNKSKGYISQLLNGDRNMTLSTLAEICFAFGYKPEIKLRKKDEHFIYQGSIEVDQPQEIESGFQNNKVKIFHNFKKAS